MVCNKVIIRFLIYPEGLQPLIWFYIVIVSGKLHTVILSGKFHTVIVNGKL